MIVKLLDGTVVVAWCVSASVLKAGLLKWADRFLIMRRHVGAHGCAPDRRGADPWLARARAACAAGVPWPPGASQQVTPRASTSSCSMLAKPRSLAWWMT